MVIPHKIFIWMWLSGAGETKHSIVVPERVYEAFEPGIAWEI